MKNILTTGELGQTLLETQKERQKNPDKYRGLPFGHADLDKDTGGARRGEMIVIAGAQKIGKTTYGINVSMSFAKKLLAAKLDEHVLYISLEMGHGSLGARVYANEATIDVTRFRDYELDEGDYARLQVTVDAYKDMPGLWDVGTYNYANLIQTVNNLEEEGMPIRAIVIDYFQLFSAKGLQAGTRRFEQLSALSRALKQYARKTGCSVIVLSQQSREALKSFKRRKDPNTIAGTQALVRDCDMLLIVLEKYDDDEEEIPHMREIYVGLSRNSPADITYDTIFVGKYARMGAPLGEEGDIEHLENLPDTQQNFWWEDDQS